MTSRLRILWFMPILLISVKLVSYQLFNDPTAPPPDLPIQLPLLPPINPSSIDTVLDRDSIPSIDNPQFEPASAADEVMSPDERVIGLVINGDARAYPITILSSHEIVNDVVGGEPVSITWCPLCHSALVFSRRVNESGDPLSFGVSGKLLYNTLVMYDRGTNSLWSQLYGGAIDGPLTGTTLSFFPSTLTEWSSWLDQFPEGQVLSKELTCSQFNCASYAVDPYESYYRSNKEGLVDNQIPRESGNLEFKRRVLGVVVAGHARAYGYDVLKNHSVINDQLGDVPLLIWFNASTETAVAFQRQLDEVVLTFKADEHDPEFLFDMETNSRWEAVTGIAVSGPLRNNQLPDVLSTTAFEFGWSAYYPHSDYYVP